MTHTRFWKVFGWYLIPLFTLMFAGALLALTGCTGCNTPRRPVHGKRVRVKGEFLKTSDAHTGCYAYRGDDGLWWYYYFAINQSTYSSSGYAYAPPASLPTTGTWVRGNGPVSNKEVIEEAEETIAEAESGNPEPEAEFESENPGVESEGGEGVGDGGDSGGDSGGGDGGGDGGGSD